jgi:hypothetical protein
MFGKLDMGQIRADLWIGHTPETVLDRLVERFGRAAERELAIGWLQKMAAAGRRKERYRPSGDPQLSFEFLKAFYPSETGAPTPVQDLSLEAGLKVRAQLLEEADNWNVPRYRDEGAEKRQEAAELERLLRLRFGDAKVDAELKGRATMTLRIIDDVIELDGIPVARLLPGLNATTVYRLTKVLEDVEDDHDEIMEILEKYGIDDDEPARPKPKPKPKLTLVLSNPEERA